MLDHQIEPGLQDPPIHSPQPTLPLHVLKIQSTFVYTHYSNIDKLNT